MAESQGDVWTTGDELRYLDGLGNHSIPGKRGDARFDRQTLLSSYLKACDKNWGNVDGEEVMDHARELLGGKI